MPRFVPSHPTFDASRANWRESLRFFSRPALGSPHLTHPNAGSSYQIISQPGPEPGCFVRAGKTRQSRAEMFQGLSISRSGGFLLGPSCLRVSSRCATQYMCCVHPKCGTVLVSFFLKWLILPFYWARPKKVKVRDRERNLSCTQDHRAGSPPKVDTVFSPHGGPHVLDSGTGIRIT
jgi:hypothetical protein